MAATQNTARVSRSRKVGKRQGRPPGTDGELTRQRIMDAAQRCFGEHGYRETTNRLIAEVADVTTGTIYHYFKNKRDMFLTIHDAIQADITKRLDGVLDGEKTLPEAIATMFKAFQTLSVDRPNYTKFSAVVRTEALRNPEIADARLDDRWRALYRNLAERGVEAGEIDPKDARALRAVLGAVVLGLTQHGMEANFADHKECLRGMALLFQGELIRDPA